MALQAPDAREGIPEDSLEGITDRSPDPPGSSVGRPLIEETGRMHPAVGNPEIPRVRRVEHLDADLEILAGAESRVLDQRQVDVPDAISSKQVARRIVDDFETNRVVSLSGWMLSVTEARAYALYTLLDG